MNNEIAQLWEQSQPILRSLVRQARKQYPYYADDLTAEGNLAFMEACRTYDSSRGAKFSSYFYMRCRRALWDYINKERGRGMCSASTVYRMDDVPANLSVEAYSDESETYTHQPTQERECDLARLRDTAAEHVPEVLPYFRSGNKSSICVENKCSPFVARQYLQQLENKIKWGTQ